MTMVGTFKRQKGHGVLITALGPVVAEHPELHVLLAGEGELEPAVRDAVAAAGMTARVHFLGTRRDVEALLAASDSFVLPSLWEGLPVALVEAMAAGLPVDRDRGERHQPGDDRRHDGLAGATRRRLRPDVCDSRNARRSRARRAMAAAGRARVGAKFNAIGQAEQLAQLFGARGSAVGVGAR